MTIQQFSLLDFVLNAQLYFLALLQAVLALEQKSTIGVDVMSLDRPINIELDEYFRLMKRQFTSDEWRQIDKASNRLHEFYR